jgi:hypothetical protein
MFTPERGQLKDPKGTLSLVDWASGRVVPWKADVKDVAVSPDRKQVAIAVHHERDEAGLSFCDLSDWPPRQML